MTLTITINTDNDAFMGDKKAEVRRIINEALKPGAGLLRTLDGKKLRDINGNTVGQITISD